MEAAATNGVPPDGRVKGCVLGASTVEREEGGDHRSEEAEAVVMQMARMTVASLGRRRGLTRRWPRVKKTTTHGRKKMKGLGEMASCCWLLH